VRRVVLVVVFALASLTVGTAGTHLSGIQGTGRSGPAPAGVAMREIVHIQ
jgi:hypothetical protein